MQEGHDQLANGAKSPLKAYSGSEKKCHRNQIHDFGARYTVEYDCVLSQQSISGKIVSLKLCVRGSQVFQIRSQMYISTPQVLAESITWQISYSNTQKKFGKFQCHFRSLVFQAKLKIKNSASITL